MTPALRLEHGAHPTRLAELLQWALERGDAYGALAVHPFVQSAADAEARQKLEETLLSRRRLKLVFASAHYTPDTALDLLASEADEPLCMRVLRHPNTAAITISRLHHRPHCTPAMLIRMAAHPHTPRDLLQALPWRSDEKLRFSLCANPSVPLPLAKQLLADGSLPEKKRLVKNQMLDAQYLELLWGSGDVYLQAETAAHPRCPRSLLRRAAASPSALVRRKLAGSRSADADIHRRLLNDAAASVRAAAVKEQTMSDGQLHRMCQDPNTQVRRNGARRRRLPDDAVKRLAADEDVWVRRWLARNPMLPAEVLAGMGEDKDENVRRSLALNPACPAAWVGRLVQDPAAWVRAAAAGRSDLSSEQLLRLARETDLDVLSAAGRNPATPRAALKAIAGNGNRDVRRAVILNDRADAEVLAGLCEDPYPLNRIIMAGREQCGARTRWMLAQDPNAEVRFSAVRTLAAQMSRKESPVNDPQVSEGQEGGMA